MKSTITANHRRREVLKDLVQFPALLTDLSLNPLDGRSRKIKESKPFLKTMGWREDFEMDPPPRGQVAESGRLRQQPHEAADAAGSGILMHHTFGSSLADQALGLLKHLDRCSLLNLGAGQHVLLEFLNRSADTGKICLVNDPLMLVRANSLLRGLMMCQLTIPSTD